MNPSNIGNPELYLSNQETEAALVEQPQPLAAESDTSTDMTEAINSLWGGFSGLLFGLSVIFLLGSPLLSAGIIAFLLLGQVGKAAYEVRQESE